jgi:predicted ArsR family transcriptional regulator
MADEPDPGTPGNPVTLTDPRMMRALAHPARIAIWTHLGLRGPATATECAEVAGLSPSACSYHLRALARYGFVEEDPGSAADGRQRPWRVRLIAFRIESHSAEPAAALAGQFLAESLRADADETRARYLARQSEYPVAWQRALGDHQDVAHVTPEELEELQNRIHRVVDDYRRLDPAGRPPGALPVRLGIDMFPWFGPEEAARDET